jgi:O-Antigen ligase/Tetratricopeptide repeat
VSGAVVSSIATARSGRRAAVAAPALVAVGALGVTVGLGAANGGYFPASWSWTSVGLLWTALILLLVRPAIAVGRAQLAFFGAALALVCWIWLSTAWSSSATDPVLEGQRALVLLGGVVAALVAVERGTVRPLLGGVLGGIVMVSAYGLATRLFPERLGSFDPVAGYRLATPVGYWNGLGVVAAMGTVLALGFAARGETRWGRVLGFASTILLLPTLYFTFGRGPWIALAVGLCTAVAIDPRRLQLVSALLVAVPGAALAVALASRSDALTHLRATRAQATHDGHRLALALLLIALAQAAVALVYVAVERRVSVSRAVRTAYASVLALVVAAALAAVFVHYGSPAHVTRRAYRAFVAKPQPHENLNARLFSLSGSGRVDLWRVAWREYTANPVLGSGAGSFQRYWMQHRPYAAQAADAHNLYVETLAELGPAGLALLLTLFAIPVAAAFRARRRPLVPFALGGLAVYVVHAVVDWDWELAGVTLVAVFCAAACVLAGRKRGKERPLTARERAIAGLVLLLASAVALAGLPGNSALSAASASAGDGDWGTAASHAHTAIRWMPWSAEGWQQLGEAQLALGELAAARRSLDKAIAKDRGNWVLWLDLAAATHGRGRQTALAEARRLNPLGPEIASFSQGP